MKEILLAFGFDPIPQPKREKVKVHSEWE